MAKRILVIGAGRFQVPLITYIQERGYEVAAVSPPGHYPGISIANYHLPYDVRDINGILNHLADLPVHAVLTDQTDIAVSTVASLSETLGLPGISSSVARLFTDKLQMRIACRDFGLPSISYRLVDRPETAIQAANELGYPVMVKPRDSQGSRGIHKVERPENLLHAFHSALSYSSLKSVLIEEFFTGAEIVIAGFASDFQFQNLCVADRAYFSEGAPPFIPSETVFPSALPRRLLTPILEANRRFVLNARLRFGITHSEFLVCPSTGRFCLVEIAARGGGVLIGSHLVPLTTGVDVYALLLGHALGDTPSVPLPDGPISRQVAGYTCFLLPSGKVTAVHGLEDLRLLPEVHEALLDDLKPGSVCGTVTDKTSRRGPIILTAPDRETYSRRLARIRNILRVDVDTDGVTNRIIW